MPRIPKPKVATCSIITHAPRNTAFSRTGVIGGWQGMLICKLIYSWLVKLSENQGRFGFYEYATVCKYLEYVCKSPAFSLIM